MIWTARQRVALGALMAAIALALSVLALRWPERPPDGPENGSRAEELASRLDPNTASCTELAALPIIGERRAREIVEFREAALSEHPDRPAFASPADLMRVKGIGEKTVRELAPFLMFPGMDDVTEPASQPATRKHRR